ncbi:MAG: acetate---CoA ligase (ADP-forming) [Syntrophus sp. SKADARSKE-3]|nr:acetate---CoA ligase (ADP-forming) [Syntrophus sp. SKADARSKE-3]
MNSLDYIFAPRSIAVIGASQTPGKVGHDIFANILWGGYRGTLYPVNPGADSVQCVKAYASIGLIPDPIDLAFIIVPPQAAANVVEESIRKGVKGIVIVSAGFREVGKEGLEIENKISIMCKEAGVRLIGPNCLGVINPAPTVSMNASFSARMPASGSISFISQSGALCTAVLDFASERDFGFSKFISIGNKADVDELDLLRYLHEDEETKVIMIYLEELRRGPEFIEAAKEITSGFRPTPILAIKSGKTTAGAKAAASHTGSLAGSNVVYDAIFEQSGIIRVDTVTELFDYATAFAYKHESVLGKQKSKYPRGNRIAIVTNAGGPGILATDMTLASGLELAEFSIETVQNLAKQLPSTANLQNPVDVIGDAAADRYEQALETVIADPGVDGVLVVLTPQSMTNALGTAEAIVRIARSSHKPIISSFMGIVDVSAGVNYLQQHGYPVYRFPENAAKAFSALYQYTRWLNRPQMAELKVDHESDRAKTIIRDCLAAGKTYLGELEGLDLLKCYGFRTLPTILVKTGPEAVAVAEGIGYPVVLKIVSPQIIHKSDAGGVEVGLDNSEAVNHAFKKIIDSAKQFDSNADIIGVLVQKMAPSGQELILGVNRYPVFGPLVMFGLGGIFVEVFQDVTFRLASVKIEDAHEMVHQIKGFKLLAGFRGKPEADIAEIAKLIVSLSNMVTENPEIAELDINPLLVHEKGYGATVADCRIMLTAEHQ